MKRYEEFVLTADKGITFEVSKEISGKLIIRARKIVSDIVYSELPTVLAGEYANVLSVYTDKDGHKAVVPHGWTVSGVPNENIIWGKNKGLVIYNIPKSKVNGIDWQNSDVIETLMCTYDQYVWTPVGLLEANGTLDGIHFNEKFGRMNYKDINFSYKRDYEPLIGELLLQKESVDKYDGYYSSRYNISKDEKTGKPRSVKGAYPWTHINFPTAKKVASSSILEGGYRMATHLMYGAEYDTREEWALETGTITYRELAGDSTKFGHYCDDFDDSFYEIEDEMSLNLKIVPVNSTELSDSRSNTDVLFPWDKIVKTGEDGCINNIYGFAGNVSEWTQERTSDLRYTVRGGRYNYNYNSVDLHCESNPKRRNKGIGFRTTLYIE